MDMAQWISIYQNLVEVILYIYMDTTENILDHLEDYCHRYVTELTRVYLYM